MILKLNPGVSFPICKELVFKVFNTLKFICLCFGEVYVWVWVCHGTHVCLGGVGVYMCMGMYMSMCAYVYMCVYMYVCG